MGNTPLTQIKPLPTFWESHRQFFPSEGSLTWFIRAHKSRLAAAGALILMRGAWHVDEVLFEREMIDIARAEAVKWVERGGVHRTAA